MDKTKATPIGGLGTKHQVLYLKNGKEHATPWYYTPARAQRALKIMQRRFGERNCILFRD